MTGARLAAGPGRWFGAVGRAVRQCAGRIADILMPPRCVACHGWLADHNTLCATCWGGVDFIRAPLCDRLGIPLPFDPGGRSISAAAAARPPTYDRARAAARYAGVVQQLVVRFKYGDQHDVRRLLGRWIAEAGREILADADVLVPVPLSRRRLIGRRFNQAGLLAQEVQRHSGVPYVPRLLERTKNTAPQVGLTGDQRRRNVAGAFAVPVRRRAEVEGRSIVLIDDVITTGATVEACASALRRAGAARIDVLAVALAIDGRDPLP